MAVIVECGSEIVLGGPIPIEDAIQRRLLHKFVSRRRVQSLVGL